MVCKPVLSTCVNKLGVGVSAQEPSIKEAETGGATGQPVQPSSQATDSETGPVSKTKKAFKDKLTVISILTHTHMNLHTCVCTHKYTTKQA